MKKFHIKLGCSSSNNNQNRYKGISNFGIDKEGKAGLYQKWLFGWRALGHQDEVAILKVSLKNKLEQH